MLARSVKVLLQQMNDHLKLSFKLTEDIVYLSSVGKEGASAYPSNRISVSIVNIEKENISGAIYSRQSVSESQSGKTTTSWQLNVYLLISAIFVEKQYKESVQMLSGVLSFLQKGTLFYSKESKHPLTLELVNLSFHELSNLWGICGGNYYPSVLCKMRGVQVNEGEIIDLTPVVGVPDTYSGIKKNEEQ